MNILITGASSRLAQAIAAELNADHELRLMDSVPVDVGGKSEFIQGSLLDTADLQRAVQGMDALIHTSEPPTHLPTDGLEREQMLLDLATRGTHNHFSAGSLLESRNSSMREPWKSSAHTLTTFISANSGSLSHRQKLRR